MCLCVFIAFLRFLLELIYHVYSVVKVLWSVEVKQLRTSKEFERYVLSRTCTFTWVFLIFTCSFWIKLMWEVLNLYTIIFGLGTSGKLSPRTTKGSLRKNPKSVCKLSKADPGDGAVKGQSWLWNLIKGSHREGLSLV